VEESEHMSVIECIYILIHIYIYIYIEIHMNLYVHISVLCCEVLQSVATQKRTSPEFASFVAEYCSVFAVLPCNDKS